MDLTQISVLVLVLVLVLTRDNITNTILIDLGGLKRLKRRSRTCDREIEMKTTVNYGTTNDETIYATAPLTSDETLILLGEHTQVEARQQFISRVYSVLWVQLLVTSVFIGLCNQVAPLQQFLVSPLGMGFMWTSMIGVLVLTCTMHCMRESLRRCLGGCSFLTVFTLMMTYILGYVGAYYSTSALLMAGLSTLGIFTGLSLYAVQTKYDYTDKGGYLICALFGLFMFGIFVPFFQTSILTTMYSCGGAMIFSFYIVYDTQLIVGGNHRSIQFRTDDIVLAATSLYLDVVNLFLMLLDLLNGRNQ
jgi:FtsH-binding integral membrane protein